MLIRRAYKDGVARDENMRKYVVPENGDEAKSFMDYKELVRGKSKEGIGIAPYELWDGFYVLNDERVPGRFVAFRFMPHSDDSNLVAHVSSCMKKGVEQITVELGNSFAGFKVEFNEPYDRDAW